MISEIKTPWESEDCLPAKPEGKEYGYLRMGRLVGCSQDELIRRCSRVEVPEIEVVWHPEDPRLVHVSSVPLLREALWERERSRQRQNIGFGAFNLCIFALMAWITWGSKTFPLFLCFALLLGGLPVAQALRVKWRSRRATLDDFLPSAQASRYAAWLASKKTPATWALFGAIALIGGLQILTGYRGSIEAAGLVKDAVRDGQWWRLCTAPLLHGHPVHLMLNGCALIVLGRLAELLGSRWHFVTVFVLSALCGSVSSLILLPKVTSIGASGGLLGLIGFLVILGYRRRTMLPPGFAKSFVVSIALVAAMGIVAYEIIDNAAHLGGYMAGMLAGIISVPRSGTLPLNPTPSVKLIGAASSGIIVVFTVVSLWKILGT